MKKFLLLIYLLSVLKGFTQCPYPALVVSTGGHCAGATLKVTSSHAFSKIIWYEGSTPVAAVSAIDSFSDTLITVAGNSTVGDMANQLVFPLGVSVDTSGNIYVADAFNQRIQKWAPGASSGVTVAGGNQLGSNADQFNNPSGLFVDNSGNLYVSDFGNNRVQKWAPGADTGVTVAGGNGFGSAADQLLQPYGVYVDCTGNIYIADQVNNRVQKWAPGATSGTTVAGGNGKGSNANQLNKPAGVWLDGSGNLYVVDEGNARVQRWAPGAATGITVAGGNGSGSTANALNTPVGLYVDATGNTYVADQDNNRIVKWAPGADSGVIVLGGIEQKSVLSPDANIASIFLDSRGNMYITDQTTETVQEFKRKVIIDSTYTSSTPGKYSAIVIDINGYPASTDTLILTSPPAGPPGIQINASATNITVCTPVTFTALPVNDGTTPSFQWVVSGVKAGEDSTVYENNIWANGDQVICIMTTDSGCTGTIVRDSSNAIVLAVDPQGHASVTIDDSPAKACQNSPVTFTATVINGAAAPVFRWLVNGIATSDSSSVYTSDSLTNGDVIYCLITSDASCGLAKSNSIPVTVYSLPTVGSGQVFTIPYGRSLVLDPTISGDIASYAWTPGTGLSDSTIRNPVADPRYTTVYDLLVTSPGGCQAKGEITIDVYTPLSIPSAFTPNGDGRNDIFYVLNGPPGSRIREFYVFNRLGQPLFQIHDGVPGDPRYGWNGYYEGQPVPPGTYVYMVVMDFANGQRQVYKGTVILVR
jgi:gliding motility-associated-like protein